MQSKDINPEKECTVFKKKWTACQWNKFTHAEINRVLNNYQNGIPYKDPCLDQFMDYRLCYDAAISKKLNLIEEEKTERNRK